MLPKVCSFVLIFVLIVSGGAYQVGVGIADCTGPPVEIRFIGYGNMDQKGCGIHLRQFSRAFIIDDGQKRAVFVSVDIFGISHAVRTEVLKNLNHSYPDTYSEENLMISATGTHSAPGGYFKEAFYDAPVLGFASESFRATVAGITQVRQQQNYDQRSWVKSVLDAHKNMAEAKIYLANGTLIRTNVNHSPFSYLYNMKEERDLYQYNVDKEMVQLQFIEASDDQPIGMINWFPVRATSMNKDNCFVSSDNLGYASILLESHFNNHSVPGRGPFVGAFASSNEGDASPTIEDPRCLNMKKECDLPSTCNASSKLCQVLGESHNYENTAMIANMLFNKSKELFYHSNRTEVTGPVRCIHRFMDMAEEVANLTLNDGTTETVTGCLPAVGDNFLLGGTDVPKPFRFSPLTVLKSTFWKIAPYLVFRLPKRDAACHYPKRIFLNTGRPILNYEWQPRIVSTQVIMLGQVVIIGVPGEFTTMSGRRLREAVQKTAMENGGPENSKALIAGLCNTYSSYVTTFEEYQLQNYEGGLTLYGPHTLILYMGKYKQLVEVLMKNESLDYGTIRPDPPKSSSSLVFRPSYDSSVFHRFGHCLQQPPEVAKIGFNVTVKFVAGNPRHSSLPNHTFLAVERLEGYEWVVIATDANWETRFYWKRTDPIRRQSVATIEWSIPPSTTNGAYRIRHYGHHKSLLGRVSPYRGTTNTFIVL